MLGGRELSMHTKKDKQLCDWSIDSGTNEPVWFQVIMNVKTDLTGLGMKDNLQKEFIQRLKDVCLRTLNMRGNMLNLRKKHIPRMKEIYMSILEEFNF